MPISPKASKHVPLFKRNIKRIPMRQLAVFCRKMSFLLDAGIPIKEALQILMEQLKIGDTVSHLHSRVMQGESFSSALRDARVFPTFMCGYIFIGEKTAQLPYVCKRLAEYYETRATIKEELTAAMIYPIAVSFMMLGIIVLAVTLVLPGYSRIFDASGIELPFFTSALLYFSNFAYENALVIVSFFLLSFFFCMHFCKADMARYFRHILNCDFRYREKMQIALLFKR